MQNTSRVTAIIGGNRENLMELYNKPVVDHIKLFIDTDLGNMDQYIEDCDSIYIENLDKLIINKIGNFNVAEINTYLDDLFDWCRYRNVDIYFTWGSINDNYRLTKKIIEYSDWVYDEHMEFIKSKYVKPITHCEAANCGTTII